MRISPRTLWGKGYVTGLVWRPKHLLQISGGHEDQ
jgi:hypothetical protein